MKFSFVIPVYNSANCLEDCVKSILSQNIADYEILLIDDGSTDDSPALCARLANQFPQVIAFHQPNGGVSSARNRGICEATGDYIMFVDSDDLLLPFAQRIWNILEEDKPDCLIFGMRFRYLKRNRAIRETDFIVPENRCMDLLSIGENFRKLFVANCFSSSCNKLYKRSVLKENNLLYNTKLTNYEDLDYSLRFLSKSSKVWLVPDICYLYQIESAKSHTVRRVSKIEDVIGSTDLIAQSFFMVEAAICPTMHNDQIRESVLDIYVTQFWSKMQTTPLRNISRYCADFHRNEYIRMCRRHICSPEKKDSPILYRIDKESAIDIWIYVRYRKLRNGVVNAVKKLLRRRR